MNSHLARFEQNTATFDKFNILKDMIIRLNYGGNMNYE